MPIIYGHQHLVVNFQITTFCPILFFKGCNRRIKYTIRLPFIRTDTGKSILGAIKGSIFMMWKGKNRVSLADRLGPFSFAGG